jgi:hypothetical protein
MLVLQWSAAPLSSACHALALTLSTLSEVVVFIGVQLKKLTVELRRGRACQPAPCVCLLKWAHIMSDRLGLDLPNSAEEVLESFAASKSDCLALQDLLK